jgi:WD40 repeat protein
MALGDITASLDTIHNVLAFDFFDNNKKLATNDYNYVIILDLETDETIFRITSANSVKDIKVSNDETMLVSCDRGYILVADIDTENLITTFTEHTGDIEKIEISNDDKKIISASRNEIYVWEIDTNNILVTFTEHSSAVYSLDISPDGTKIASAGDDQNIQIWDITSGEIIQTIVSAHDSQISSLNFHPDGNKILSGGADNKVKIWNLTTGEVEKVFSQHNEKINDCKYFPDGKRVVSGDENNNLYIWDIEKDEIIFSSEKPDPVDAVCCNTDGSKVAVGYYKNAEVIEIVDSSGLVLTNKYGQIFNTDPDFLSIPIELGKIIIAESSEIYEIEFLNNKKVAVKNVTITTSDEKTGVDLTFSKNQSPFDDLQSVIYPGPYNPGESDTFYIKLNTDLEAAKGENNLAINTEAEFAK